MAAPDPEEWPVTVVPAGAAGIAVRTFGRGPPVVMLHGFADDGRCFGPVAAMLAADGWRVALVDARGHGTTPMPPGEPFSVDGHVADVAAVVESLGAEAVLVGHSMGAMTALALTARRPELVRGAFLEDPAFDAPRGGEEDAAIDADNPFERWVRDLQWLDHSGRVERSRAEHPSWPEDERGPWARAKARVDVALFPAPQSWLRRSWQPSAAALQRPALLVAGEPALGSAVTPDAAQWLQDHTAIRVVRVPGAGHNVRREQRAAYLSLLRDLLRSVATPPRIRHP